MKGLKGEVIAVNISSKKGTRKTPIEKGFLKEDYGLLGDAHAEEGSVRQVSLLSEESIESMRKLGLQVGPGDFAENITVKGFNVFELQVGTKLKVGETLLEITQIGKDCHTKCAIFRQVGKCIMPKEGVFAKVLMGGWIKKGDPIEVIG